jgi:hypothetical protein
MIARLALFAALLAASSGALAQTKLFVLSPATLDPDAPIAADVKAECKLPEIVGDNTVLYVQKHLRRAGVAAKISDVKEAGDGLAVKVTILAAYEMGLRSHCLHRSPVFRAAPADAILQEASGEALSQGRSVVAHREPSKQS